MARGCEDKASTAEPLQLQTEKTPSESKMEVPLQTEEDTSSESEMEDDLLMTEEDDEDGEVEVAEPDEGSAAALLGNSGVISVLLETPSGFALFRHDAFQILEPDAWQNIWADFVRVIRSIVWLEHFQRFEDKVSAINQGTGVSEALATMIREHIGHCQTLVVGNEDYKKIIEKDLDIPCLYSPAVEELMWGLKFQMRQLVPAENSELINDDRLPMSEGIQFLLNRHGFEVKPDMMVNKRIIEMAHVVYECDSCVNKYNRTLRLAAKHLKEISHIDSSDWDLLKLVTALKMICYPGEKIAAARQLFRKRHLKRLRDDAPKYENKIFKVPCLEL